MKSVLVIGGLGFIGAEVSALLSRTGYDVTVYDDMSIGSPDRLNDSAANITIIKGDIRNETALTAALRSSSPDIVINLAAIHYIPQCVADPYATLDVNVMGMQRLISAMKAMDKVPKLIMASSASVYGSPKLAPQDEMTEIAPVDVYGNSKVMDELLIRSSLENYLILRLFNVFGADDPHSHLIPNIIRQLDDSHVRLGNRTSRRDYVFVKDVARAFLAAAQSNLTGKTYNVGSGKTHSVEEVCEALKKASHKQVVFEFETPVEMRKKDPAVLHAAIGLIKEDLGWTPTIGFEEGIQAILARPRSKE